MSTIRSDIPRKAERTALFRRGQWGVFLHFLARENAHAPVTVLSWNARVERFDVETLATQLSELEAGYCGITLGQNSGWYCSPNASLDRWTGRTGQDSHCSHRDLVAEFSAALRFYEIPLMVYLPTHAPAWDDQAMKSLQCIPEWDFHLWSPARQNALSPFADPDSRLGTFQRRWEEVIAEWSCRWGSQVSGWWLDGCFYRDKMYDFPEEPNFHSLAAAVRRGNPEACFCVNPGVFPEPISITAEEDFTSGETDFPVWRSCFEPCQAGAFYHVLAHLGADWGYGPLQYTAQEIFSMTANVVDGGGMITWDVPFNQTNGTLPKTVMNRLKNLRKKLNFPRPRLVAQFTPRQLPEIRANGTELPGDGILTLKNCGQKTWSNTLTLSGNPDCRLVLQPEEIRTIPAVLPAELSAFKVRCRNWRRSWPYDCKRTVDLTHSPVFQFVSSGRKIAEITATSTAKFFRLDGIVYETESQIHPDLWRGSCFEIFLSNQGRITQYFFPPSQAARHGFRLLSHTYCEAPESRYRMERLDKEYRFSLEVPFPDLPENVSFECKCTIFRDGSFQHVFLFGSEHPECSDEKFAHIQPKGYITNDYRS